MLSSASLVAARRVLTSTGAAAPLRQSIVLAARALVLRPAAPSLRLISTSAPMRAAAAKATKTKSTKSAATKKPAAKKKAAAKPKAKKPVKKKVAVKKKKVAAKKPKKVVKKKKVVLTDEQKDRLEIRRLRKIALLKGPTLLPVTAWNVFMLDSVRGGEGSLTDKVKALAISFKNLPEAERERLASVGKSNKAANEAAKKKWVESFPPEAIHSANLARRRLARMTDKSKTYLIHDERIPQRPGSGFTFYIKEHFSENEGSATEAMRTLGERWKALSDSEKAPYLKKAADISEENGSQLKELREKGAKYWKDKLAEAKK
ncbi:hypothetical protein ACQKWADRAFT_291991 [Trichoderma austrokoningii]